MTAAAMLAAASCSDFSDYNEVPVDPRAEGNQTLWQNISSNPELKGFAQLVEKSGLQAELDNSKSFTVWAPKDGSYDLEALLQQPADIVLSQIVQNHVAEYSHQAVGEVSERIRTLNDKKYDFTGTAGSYTFNGIPVTSVNQPSNNGIIHVIDQLAPFRHNLYEYLKEGEGFDKLREQFMRYEETTLDETNSVKGPMVDGQQTYIDSVLITRNTLVNQLNARLTNEDSTYTFILPTDRAFDDMYARVAKTFNFLNTTIVADIMNYTSTASTNTKTSPTIVASELKDSLVRQAITRNLIYSNNDYYNKLWQEGASINDTLRSTRRVKLANGTELFNDYLVGEPIQLSNGIARLVDSLAFQSWDTFCPELEISPRTQYNNNGVKIFPAEGLNINERASIDTYLLDSIFGPDHGLTNYRYLSIRATGERTKPDVFIKLPDVQSTAYNFYVVYLPQARPELGGDARPNKLNYQLDYCAANGKKQTYNFSVDQAAAILNGEPVPTAPTAVNRNTAFENDPEKLDTVFIGQFTFPVCYAGLGDYTPTLHISNPMNMLLAAQRNLYNRDLRIAAIILRPVEQDEYKAKNQ